MSDNKPINEIRAGALRLAFWKNEGEDGPYLSSSLTRIYKDTDGELKRTSTLRPQDMAYLPFLGLEGNRFALEFERAHERKASRDDNPTSDVGYADDRKREPARQRGRQYRR